MLTVPALKINQFSQSFYLLNLSASDVDRLVKFEVLGDAGLEGKKPGKARSSRASPVNWEEIEKKVSTSEEAFQRPVLRKKLDELVQFYRQSREDGVLPAIPGAVLLTSSEPVEFVPNGGNPLVGLVQMTAEDGQLRVLDGQHRLLALAAMQHSEALTEEERAEARTVQVPAILFAGLPPPAVVEMFVTINSKHTRLNPSLLFSLRGRQLYADALDARIHDALRRLNDREDGALEGHVKMLGVGEGKVAQAGLAQELRALVSNLRARPEAAPWIEDFEANLHRFLDVYFQEVSRVFEDAWRSRKHSVRSGTALRAFIAAGAEVATRMHRVGGDSRAVVRRLLEPWGERVGSGRFETAGEWRTKQARGGRDTSRLVARELVAALGPAGEEGR